MPGNAADATLLQALACVCLYHGHVIAGANSVRLWLLGGNCSKPSAPETGHSSKRLQVYIHHCQPQQLGVSAALSHAKCEPAAAGADEAR